MSKTKSSLTPGILFIIAAFMIVLLITVLAILLNLTSSTSEVQSTVPNPTQAVVQNLSIAPDTESTPLPAPTEVTPQPPVATTAQWMPLPPISEENYRGLITNGSRDQYKIALTFDFCEREGEPAGFDSEIIRILKDTQSPATLFLGGLWMQNHQAETLELASHPLFELGNHSWSHPDFSSLSGDEMQQQILLAQQKMYELLGFQTNLFRFPYGTYNEEALNAVNDNGLYIIQWDDVSGDPDPNINAEAMTSWVLQQAQPGSIIIMHANGRGWHTAEALPGIIQSLRERGYTLVTVSELLNIEPYK